MSRHIYIWMMAMVLVWTGCELKEEPEQTETFSLSVCLPADETNLLYSTRGMRKAMGDPGTKEQFTLPKYIYIFIAKEYSEDNWKVWEQITIDDADDSWEKDYYSGVLMGSGDSIYRYTKTIIKPLATGERFEGRVYAIASALPLTFDTTLTNSTSTLNALLDLKFSTTTPATMQMNLQHIYSTPYNYEIEDKYYGSFSSIVNNVPRVNIMLYHVAAKVDLTWYVADSARIKKTDVDPIRLTYMDACNLFNGDAYCFKPMENSSGASPLNPSAGAGDTIHIVTPTDEGLWWEGRSYFYTIPYSCTSHAGYFPLQMKMATNGDTEYYRPTIYLHVDKTSPFVPWMRATFNLNNPLTAGTANKIVD